MRVINVTPEMSVLPLGRLGENEVTKFVFDVSDWLEEYPGGTIGLANSLPHARNGYACSIESEGDGKYSWTITSAELTTEGKGRCELILIKDSKVKKGKVYKTLVGEALDPDADPPEAWQGYVTKVMDCAAAVIAAAHGQQIRFSSNDSGHLVFSYSEDEEVTEETEWTDVDLGPVNAYAMAVLGGYSGTAAQFEQYMADIANGAASASASATSAAASAADALEHTQSVIETWLGNNITPGSQYALDRTLALTNAAAPADMAGNILADKRAIENNLMRKQLEFEAYSTPPFNIVDGGIDTYGHDSSNEARCRTKYFNVTPGKPYMIQIDSSSYSITSVWTYDKSSSPTVLIKVPNHDSLSVVFTADATVACCRISFKRNDEANITSEDKDAILGILKIFTLTDNTLTEENMPADGKATGEKIAKEDFKIEAIKETAYSIEEYNWGKIGTSNYPLGWRTGYYQSSDGSAKNSGYYIRTVDTTIYFRDAAFIEVTPPTGYNVIVTKYDITTVPSTYVSRVGTFSEKGIFLKEKNRGYKFHVGRFDNNDSSDYLTSTFINQIKVRVFSMTGKSKKERTGDYEFFTVKVDRPLSFGGEEQREDVEEIECVLRLPSDYSPAGEPKQLVLACHGAHGYIDSANTTWYNANWKTFMDALLSAGYAVFDSNIFETSTGTGLMGLANGSPLYVNVLKKAYDYILLNYNVKEKIFVHGTSMGGTGATAFAHAYPGIVLAESSFAGREVIRYIWSLNEGNAADSYAKAYGYDTVTDLNNDKFSHIEGAFPSLSLVKYIDGIAQIPPDRDTNYQEWLDYYSQIGNLERDEDAGIWIGKRTVPYKAWNSWEDNEAYTKLQTVLKKAYNRGNACPYYVVNYESGTHTNMSYGQINDMIPQLIEWYKRWE